MYPFSNVFSILKVNFNGQKFLPFIVNGFILSYQPFERFVYLANKVYVKIELLPNKGVFICENNDMESTGCKEK